jgi:hypoxanthine phosphoribosyltransferase
MLNIKSKLYNGKPLQDASIDLWYNDYVARKKVMVFDDVVFSGTMLNLAMVKPYKGVSKGYIFCRIESKEGYVAAFRKEVEY